jgi:transcriptional regulator with XRE-family HTH domain
MIRNERTRQRLTQDELAARIGARQPYIANLEQGKKHPMNDKTIDALFGELKVTAHLGQREFVKFWRDNADRA